jgi:hypothetical protein
MAITYTWKTNIDRTKPYNISSSQANIVETIQYTLTATEDGGSTMLAGAMSFDVNEGVSGTFTKIEDITEATLQGWVETRLGSTKIASMKSELASTLALRDSDWEPTPSD